MLCLLLTIQSPAPFARCRIWYSRTPLPGQVQSTLSQTPSGDVFLMAFTVTMDVAADWTGWGVAAPGLVGSAGSAGSPDTSDHAPGPAEFTARTRTRYVREPSSPVIVAVVAVPLWGHQCQLDSLSHPCQQYDTS